MNINHLFEQFIQPGKQAAAPGSGHSSAQDHPTNGAGMVEKLTTGTAGGFAGGLAAGGLLGALIGNKKMRKTATKMAGGAVGYGGSAILGALALKAYQNWQTNKGHPENDAGPAPKHSVPITPEKFDPIRNEDATGQPLQLTLVKAMIAAANADGHIDGKEQAAVFDAVERMDLDSDSKAVIFDVLRNPPTITQIASHAEGLEQASEIYLASRLAIDPDHPSEKRYLKDLAKAMKLPAGLVQEIEAQFEPEPAPKMKANEKRFGRKGKVGLEPAL